MFQQQLQPTSITLNLKPTKMSEHSDCLESGKENNPNEVNRKRSKSKGYSNKPPLKPSIRIEEPLRSRDLVTPANRINARYR